MQVFHCRKALSKTCAVNPNFPVTKENCFLPRSTQYLIPIQDIANPGEAPHGGLESSVTKDKTKFYEQTEGAVTLPSPFSEG